MIASLVNPKNIRPTISDVIDLNAPLKLQTKRAVQHLERKIILGVLQANKWNRRKAARSLDISYRGLLYKIKEAGLPSVRSTRNAARPQSRSTRLLRRSAQPKSCERFRGAWSSRRETRIS